MAGVDLSSINVISELERIGWDFEFVGDNEVKCRCPAHTDKTASACINLDKKVWKCHTAGCSASGDFVTFLALALKGTRRVIFQDLSSRYDFESVKTIDPSTVEKYHLKIWAAGPMLKQLKVRGISDVTIRRYRLGFHNNRITIPIPNERGSYVNIRRYMPGAPGNEKMRNTRGHGELRLYPIEQLTYDTIVIAGGELKALVVAQHLNDRNVGAVAATGGEGNWHTSFSSMFKGKRVFLCYDIDAEGRKGADSVCARLKSHVDWIGVLQLPLEIERYPHGDVNDYFGLEDGNATDFEKLMDETVEWKPSSVSEEFDENDEPEKLTLSLATKAVNVGKRVVVEGVVTAMDTTPYLVPRKIICDCDRNQSLCSICPVYALDSPKDKPTEMTINRESAAIIAMVNTTKKEQQSTIREGLRIPPCKSISFKAISHYNVEDIRVTPQLEIASRQSDQIMLPALSVSHGIEMNASYKFTGRTYPHPKTQQAIMLISKSEASGDTLSQYAPSEDELRILSAFQPDEWSVEGIKVKLDEVYKDFEANVTRIFQRRPLHLAVDLVFHSPLLFNFDKQLTKGWVEALVIGDSSQGKTETSKQMMGHYGLGERVECKNASRAGLLGGVQQLGNRWFVTWGVIPLHDRRLVILEELKGASTELIGSLTDMRSTGIAELSKIDKRRTHARTRLLALSNPRGDLPISSYNYGVEAIRELIGSPEDIRRFDFALVVAATDVSIKELNRLSTSRPEVEHVYKADMCKRCVLWAWTRTPEQVEFTKESTELILKLSVELCSVYSETIPLVDRGSMRLKLARLAASLACRTFSTGKTDLQKVVIRPCHVEYISQYLTSAYNSDTFGYADYSRAYMTTRILKDKKELARRVFATPFPSDVIDQLLYAETIELRDICDWCGWERGQALELLSFMVRKHALHRVDRGYRKNPEFISLLKDLRNSEELKIADRPAHIKEDF